MLILPIFYLKNLYKYIIICFNYNKPIQGGDMKKISILFLAVLVVFMGCKSPTIDTPAPTPTPAATYTVTFDSNGGSAVAAITGIASGAKITQPADPTKTSNTFAGWYKADLITAWNFATDTVTSSITLYAKWTPVPVAGVSTVTFDSQSATVAASPVTKTVTAPATTIDALPTAPTKTGFTFDGWWTAANGGGTKFDVTTSVTATITVYAKWIAVIPGTFAVTFESNGGSAVAAITGIASGAKITQPADPTKTSNTFAGWYKEVGLATPWNFTTDTVTADKTLYAKWTPIVTTTYTITFESNGGSVVTAITGIANGAKITQPANPTLSGNTFAGWYKEVGLTTAWNFATDTVTADKTLYAKWTPIVVGTYTITFDSNGGSAVTPIASITSGTTITAPTAPTKSGNTFVGWYKESGLTTTWNFATDTVTADKTLYAKWTVNTYQITFHGNGSDSGSMTNQTLTYGTPTAITSNAFSKTGYTFAGWSITSGVATVSYFNSASYSIGTANADLYAQWTINTYTVSYNVDGGSTIADTSANYNALISAPIPPTKSGYTFDKWYKSDLTTAWNFGSDTITANTTLYAKWKSSNASLATLSLSEATISPGFSAGTISYTASVANGISSVTINATVADGTATIHSGDTGSHTVSVGSGNNLAVLVTAQDGTTKTYTIVVTRAAITAGSTAYAYKTSDYKLYSKDLSSAGTAWVADTNTATSGITSIAIYGSTAYGYKDSDYKLYSKNLSSAGTAWIKVDDIAQSGFASIAIK